MNMTFILLCILGILLVVAIFIFYKDRKESNRIKAYSGTAKSMNELLCAIKVDESISIIFNDSLKKSKLECINSFIINKNKNINYNYKIHAVYNMIKIAKKMAFNNDLEEYKKEIYKRILVTLYGIVYKHFPNNFDKNIFDLKCKSIDSSDEEKKFCKQIENLYITDIIKNEQYKKNPTNNIDTCAKNIHVGLSQLTIIDQYLEIISNKHIHKERVKEIIKNSIYEEKNLNILLYNIDKKDNTIFQCVLSAFSSCALLECQKLEKKQNLSIDEKYLIKDLLNLHKVTFNECLLYDYKIKRTGKYDISKEEYELMYVSERFDIVDIILLDNINPIIEKFIEENNIITDVKNLIIKYINKEIDEIIYDIKHDKKNIISELVYNKIEVICCSAYLILEKRSVSVRDTEAKNELLRIKKILLKIKEQKFVDKIFNNNQ